MVEVVQETPEPTNQHITADNDAAELTIAQQSSAPKEYYVDPEGGYADEEVGRQAELAAMTKQAPISQNNLPTKAYLEQTITPTVMKALSEVCKARPDNPLEFVAYYVLKHNPARELENEGIVVQKPKEVLSDGEDGDRAESRQA